MSENIVPPFPSLAQMRAASLLSPRTIAQRALQEVLAHPKKYPVRVQPHKGDDRLNVNHTPRRARRRRVADLTTNLFCTEAELCALCAATTSNERL